ncbi:MAG: hypothetical protein AB7J28_04710 [Hyphomonadaceae bacterium]
MGLLWRAAALALSVTCAGCMSSNVFLHRGTPLAQQMAEFNDAAAESDRQLIVQNILRARDRESLSFARVSQFRSTATRQVTTGVGSTLNEGAGNDIATPSLSVVGSTAPAFDFPVLSTQNFSRAIHNRVDPELYFNLTEQGWPSGLLHMLFIENMELSCTLVERTGRLLYGESAAQAPEAPAPGQEMTPIQSDELARRSEVARALNACARDRTTMLTLSNDPTEWGAYEQFYVWVRILLSAPGAPWRVCSRNATPVLNPPLQPNQPVDVGDLVTLSQRPNLSWVRDADQRWQLRRTGAEYRFALGCAGHKDEVAVAIAEEPREQSGAGSSSDSGRVRLRSLVSILYYLGEVAREETEHPTHIVRAPQLNYEPATPGQWESRLGDPAQDLQIFRLTSNGAEDGVRVRHHGETYVVPYTPAAPGVNRTHRSQQVIELLLQILNLFQTREDLPSTPTVNIAR